MRFSTSLVLGAASTVLATDQKVLNKQHHEQSIEFGTEANDADTWWTPFEKIWGETTDEVKATWDDISLLMPGAFDTVRKMAVGTPRKSANRRPDSHFDYHVHGSDLAELFVETDGVKHRKVDGDLENYSLRARHVDTAKLGLDTVKQFAGYLDDNEKDKHLFYWFFESRNDPKNDPVLLWLNGGPGCSSMLGLLFELGPSHINKKLEPVYNPHAWNSNASVIFLEQPINVGYSHGSPGVTDTIEASKDVYALLSLFFHQFPEYAHQDFHLAGESYGGHYVPVFAKEILSHKDRNINIKSALVGNGLSDTLRQYQSYIPYGCEGKGGWPGVIPKDECKAMEKALPRCLELIERCYDTESSWTCTPAHIFCNNAEILPYSRTGQNPYDIRDPCTDIKDLCYPGVTHLTEYLNLPEVQEAVGAEVDDYGSCNWDVNRDFMLTGDWNKPFYRMTTDVIEEIPMLIYAGDADFICNWMGIKQWTEELEWPGKEDYNAVELGPLTFKESGEEYGQIKSHGNFTFIRIYAAGHMVPHDQPESAIDFFNRWLGGEWA